MKSTGGYIYLLFRLLLRKEGVNFKTTAEFEIVRIIKEKACYLALNPQKEETGATETETYQYILPDGSTLDVSQEISNLNDNFGKLIVDICRSVRHGFALLRFFSGQILSAKSTKVCTRFYYSRFRNQI